MTTASEWADKITDAAKGVPGSLSWDEVHCLIFEALCKAEADGFRRGRQVGSEGAILAVRQYFADGQECIPAAALPTADACERCIRAFMEKPDE